MRLRSQLPRDRDQAGEDTRPYVLVASARHCRSPAEHRRETRFRWRRNADPLQRVFILSEHKQRPIGQKVEPLYYIVVDSQGCHGFRLRDWLAIYHYAEFIL